MILKHIPLLNKTPFTSVPKLPKHLLKKPKKHDRLHAVSRPHRYRYSSSSSGVWLILLRIVQIAIPTAVRMMKRIMMMMAIAMFFFTMVAVFLGFRAGFGRQNSKQDWGWDEKVSKNEGGELQRQTDVVRCDRVSGGEGEQLEMSRNNGELQGAE